MSRKGALETQAIEDFGRALRLDPKSATALLNRCYVYGQKHQYGRAI